ncbi:MAG: hypothetical protein ACYDEC_13100 [Bacteroidia bacterium]
MKKTIITIVSLSAIVFGMGFSTQGLGECNSVMHTLVPPAGYAGDPMGGGKTCNAATCHTPGPTPVVA